MTPVSAPGSQVRLLDVGTYLVLESVLGPAFWLHTVYSYLLTGAGTFLLLRNFVRMPRVYRRQASALLVAVCAPWAGNIVYGGAWCNVYLSPTDSAGRPAEPGRSAAPGRVAE